MGILPAFAFLLSLSLSRFLTAELRWEWEKGGYHYHFAPSDREGHKMGRELRYKSPDSRLLRRERTFTSCG